MMLLAFQEPPRPAGASQRVRITPVLISSVFSWPSAKKPMLELSGDQNGKIAPSAPGKMC